MILCNFLINTMTKHFSLSFNVRNSFLYIDYRFNDKIIMMTEKVKQCSITAKSHPISWMFSSVDKAHFIMTSRVCKVIGVVTSILTLSCPENFVCRKQIVITTHPVIVIYVNFVLKMVHQCFLLP